MRSSISVIVIALLGALLASKAVAQVTLDVSKLTCEQFVNYKVANPHDIAIWLSGYYHGTRSDSVLDVQDMIAKRTKVEDFCVKNMEMPLLKAMETVLGGGERK